MTPNSVGRESIVRPRVPRFRPKNGSRRENDITMTAWLLGLHRLDTGRHVAWEVLCAEARYCSLALPGVSKLVRRMLSASEWKVVTWELSMGLNPGPLPASGPIAKALAGEAGANVIAQYLTSFDIETGPMDVARALDSRLLSEPH